MKRGSVIVGVILTLTMALVGCGAESTPAAKPESSATQQKGDPKVDPAAKPVELTIAHVVKTTDNFHLAALKFKQEVETKSNGQITVNIVPEGKAGPEKDLLTKTQSGEIDGAISTAGSATSFVGELGLFDLPFLFDSADHVHKVLDGKVGQGIHDKLQAAGFKSLGVLDFGFRHLTNSKVAVKKPEDVAGLKLRVLPNAIYQSTWELATGAKPIVMNWTEVPQALKDGAIDGQENPISILVSYKLWETQKYASKTGHVFAVALFVMNPAKFDKLTPEQQKIVTEAGRVAVEESRRFTAEAEEKGWATLRENGMTVVEDVDRAAFRKLALDAMSKKFASQVPADWMAAVSGN